MSKYSNTAFKEKQAKFSNKTKKNEIREKIISYLKFLSEENVILHSNTLYEDVDRHIRDNLGDVNYNIKRKIICELKKQNHTYVPISTIARIENKKRYFRALGKKQESYDYPIKRLNCTHMGVWIRKENLSILRKAIKTSDRNGNAIIHCYFHRNTTNNNGYSKLQKYIDNLSLIMNGRIARHKKHLEKFTEIIEFCAEKWNEVQEKVVNGLSTDFMSFVQFIHRKMYGYQNKIKNTIQSRSEMDDRDDREWRHDKKRVRLKVIKAGRSKFKQARCHTQLMVEIMCHRCN